MQRSRLVILTFAAALTLLAAASPRDIGQTAFSTPLLLQHTYTPPEAVGAIDDAGNVLAVWANAAEYEFSQFSITDNAWSPLAAIGPQSGSEQAEIARTPAGAGIGIFANSLGTYAANLPFGAMQWSSPQQLDGTYAGKLVYDSSGDAAWLFAAGTTLGAVRLNGGSTIWGAVETVATVKRNFEIAIDSAAMGEDGSVLVTWQSFTCGKGGCNGRQLHGSRATGKGGAWKTPPPLASSPTGNPNIALVDPLGNAAIVLQPSRNATSLALSELAPGAKRWSTPVTIYAQSSNPLPLQLLGSAVDQNGTATIVFGQSAVGYAPVGIIYSLQGSLVAERWGNLTDVTGDPNTTIAPLGIGSNRAGGLVVGWSDADGSLHVTAKVSSASAWETPQELLGAGGPCNGYPAMCQFVSSAAIDDAGHAALLMSQRTGNPYLPQFDLYASTR